MRIRLTPGTALLLLVLATVVTAGATEKQERVFAKVNRTFQVKLQENPSTGFRWEASFDRELLVLQSRTYIPDPRGAGRVGVGGTAVFSFLPLKKGTTTIIMRYNRPWERGTAPEMLVRVSIAE